MTQYQETPRPKSIDLTREIWLARRRHAKALADGVDPAVVQDHHPAVDDEPDQRQVRDALDSAVLAVETGRDYLVRVARWLAGRTAFGRPLMDNAVLRQRLALAITAHRSADAVLDQLARDLDSAETDTAGIDTVCAIVVDCVAECVRKCEEVHAGAGVFDRGPDTVHRLQLRQRQKHGPESGRPWPGRLGRLNPLLADRLRAALVLSDPSSSVPPSGLVTAEARRLVSALEQTCPVDGTTLLDDLIMAEVLAELLTPGLAARVMTHRQVVRSYLTGPGAAPEATRLLPAARTGSALAAIAVTEPEVGSDLSSLKATIYETASGPVLEGIKTYVAGAADCDFAVMAARSKGGLVLVLVDTSRPEVRRTLLGGRAWRGVGFAELAVHSYSLSEQDLYRGPGADALFAGLARERMMLAAQQLAYARRWITDVPRQTRADLVRRLSAAQALLEGSLLRAGTDAVSLEDSSIAKFACCAVAADVAVARTAALAGQPGGRLGEDALEELLDDQASARACTFAGGSADINLALVEGSIVSMLASPRLEGRRPQ
ncbi:acyl-CoA dehydrogenase family protein [Streptomyces sp. NBC_00258]|uniref:acyl-CoA dehydrogenase family protein n=1 Tax=Streptomyces sp. NBC_00258 TaxID=2903642 RepID=UPI002E294198|nr:acyl-CoA dehydrogenase family protein [Streptomyces sp. NBC_00258]